MNLSLQTVIREAGKIKFKIDSGVLIEGGCGMSAVQTPAKEAWSVTEDLVEQGELTSEGQEKLLSMLNKETKSHLQATKFDDFDLIHEFFLQVIDGGEIILS
jgi:hypothetical protein